MAKTKVTIETKYAERFTKLVKEHCNNSFAKEIIKTKQVGHTYTTFIAPKDSSDKQITKFKKFAKVIDSKKKIKKVLKKYVK